jgi:hypothetical protein
MVFVFTPFNKEKMTGFYPGNGKNRPGEKAQGY